MKESFGNYPMPGDSIRHECGEFTIVARIEPDPVTHVNEFDCYTEAQVTAWMCDEWHFAELVIDVYCGDSMIEEAAWSLCGIDNFMNDTSGAYFDSLVEENAEEAINEAMPSFRKLAAAALRTLSPETLESLDYLYGALLDGIGMDIWYDAHEHGDHIAERNIDETQEAMARAARALREIVKLMEY